MIPTTTGAAKAVGLVLPELKGKLDGSAIRVPTPNVSVVDFKFVAKRKTSTDEINNAVKAAANGNSRLKGVLGYTDQPNVSSDFNHDDRSSVFHLDQTKVIDGDFVRVLSWYDNEWGFSNRMADTAVAHGEADLEEVAFGSSRDRRCEPQGVERRPSFGRARGGEAIQRNAARPRSLERVLAALRAHDGYARSPPHRFVRSDDKALPDA